MSVAAEQGRIRALFEHVEGIEAVASTLAEPDERRQRLLDIAAELLAGAGAIRPVIAASLLELSDKTIRAWTREGVLKAVGSGPNLTLDPLRVHEVMHLVRELRANGQDRNLLDAVWYRLSDQALLDRDDLRESLEQMRRGEGRVVRPNTRPAGSVM
jgi:hypothetical protein